MAKALLQFSFLMALMIAMFVLCRSFQTDAAIAAVPEDLPERVLTFPERVGKLEIKSPRELNEPHVQEPVVTLKAEGTVKIPRGRIVILRPDYAHAENTAIFKKFQANDFQGVDLNDLPITAKGLGNLLHITGIQWLETDDTELGDDAMLQLARLPKLKRLRISRTLITDRGVQYLKQIRSLRRLNISKNDLNNSALKIISEMPWLVDLDVSRLRLTNDGVRHLAGMPNLMRLEFMSNELLDDRCTAYLTTLPKLSRLNVSGTHMTMKSLPNFKKIKNLVELKVNKKLFSPEDVQKLRRELAGVDVEAVGKKLKVDMEVFEPLH